MVVSFGGAYGRFCMIKNALRPDLLLMIRGVAALVVVLWHVHGYRGEFPNFLNIPGRVGVWIFFGMSGYLIAHGFLYGKYQYIQRDLINYWRNRLLRIYPLFLLISAVSIFTAISINGNSPITLRDVPSQLLALQWTHDYILVGVFWTLGVEIQFYLLAPFVIWILIASKQSWRLLGIGMYLAMWGWPIFAALYLNASIDSRDVLGNMQHFLAGILACMTLKHRKFDRPDQDWRRPMVASLIFLGLANYLYHVKLGLFMYGGGALLVDAAIYLMVRSHALFESGRVRNNIAVKAFTFTGILSYGIYAWHGYLMKYVPWTSDKFFILVALSFILAWVSYRLLEIPVSKLRRRAADIPHPEVRKALPN